MTVDALEVTPVRCPNEDLRKLMFQVRYSGDKPTYIDGLEIELACDDCKRLYRRQGMTVKRVLHRFNVLGECTETVIVRAGR